MIYVDRHDGFTGDLSRYRKKSFSWYRHVIETNGAELQYGYDPGCRVSPCASSARNDTALGPSILSWTGGPRAFICFEGVYRRGAKIRPSGSSFSIKSLAVRFVS